MSARVENTPRYGSRVDRSWFNKPVRGASWQPASAPVPAEQDSIVRAHRLTGSFRTRRAVSRVTVSTAGYPHHGIVLRRGKGGEESARGRKAFGYRGSGKDARFKVNPV